MSKFSQRYLRINELKVQIISSKLEPINYATSYLEESVKCFHERLPISCIVVSSALVERTLFWQKIIQNPPKAGTGMRSPNLGHLFKEFMDWGLLHNSLLDGDERLNLKLVKERKAKECDPKKAEKWDTKIGNIFSKARYVETRNLFAHGKELLVAMPLGHLLPADTYALSEYGINSEEWWKPTFETIAYVHLSKTLCFMKSFTGFMIPKKITETKKKL